MNTEKTMPIIEAGTWGNGTWGNGTWGNGTWGNGTWGNSIVPETVKAKAFRKSFAKTLSAKRSLRALACERKEFTVEMTH